MQGNKDKNYSLQENEAGMYHVRFTKIVGTARAPRKLERTQQFSVADFNSLIKVIEGDEKRKIAGQGMDVLGWHEMQILHDPILHREQQEKAQREADKRAEAQMKAEQEAAAAAKAKEKAEKPKRRPQKNVEPKKEE